MLQNDIAELVRITQRELAFEAPFRSLRGIACELKGEDIVLYFYNNGPFCDDLRSDYFCLSSEVNAHYPDDQLFDEEIIRIDEPLPLPQHAHWAYQNAHPSFSSNYPKISERHAYLLKMVCCGLKSENHPSWRGLAVDWDEEEIMIHLYYEGEFTAQSSEKFQRLCQSISDDCHTKRLNIKSLRCDSPSPLPSHEYWAFLRDAPALMACETSITSKYSIPSSTLPLAKHMTGQELSEQFASLRGIIFIEDQNKTLNLHYYNDGPISQELKDYYRELGNEILSQSGRMRLHERFTRLDTPEPLPQSSNWLYKNLTTAISSLHPQISLKHKHLIGTTQTLLSTQPLPYLRGVAVDWDCNGHTILMHSYHNRELSEKEKQRCKAFGEEILSHYPITQLDQRILYMHPQVPLPEHEYWVCKNS